MHSAFLNAALPTAGVWSDSAPSHFFTDQRLAIYGACRGYVRERSEERANEHGLYGPTGDLFSFLLTRENYANDGLARPRSWHISGQAERFGSMYLDPDDRDIHDSDYVDPAGSKQEILVAAVPGSSQAFNGVRKTHTIRRITNFGIDLSVPQPFRPWVDYLLYRLGGVEVKGLRTIGGQVMQERVQETMALGLPQVIQQTQVAFSHSANLQRFATIQVVNEWARFLYFRREDVPELDRANYNDDGYRPAGSVKGQALSPEAYEALLGFSYHRTRVSCIIRNVGDTDVPPSFDPVFKRHWNEFIAWTKLTDNLHFPII
ncbi:hypothetical protein PENSPDRAFT_685490 [Peniophora sp. CONT]|nr:hypothetical protein PENSPDRAFT_685490 [Peniophora sp. CONT]